MRVLWLRPDTGPNVSIRRERIAAHLQDESISITFQNVRPIAFLSAIRMVLFGEFDIVIANVRFPLYIGAPLAFIRRNPLIADVSDPLSQISGLPGPIYRFLSWYEWWLISRADFAVFADSRSYETAKARSFDARLVKNGVDFDRFAKPEPETIAFAENELTAAGVKISSPIAIYTGRFSPAYHLEETVLAAELIPEWEFVFVGERGMQGRIERAAKRLDNVYYLGSYPHDRMPGFLERADVGLCLVDEERPLKLLEYGAAGIPVLGIPGKLEDEFPDSIWYVQPIPEDIAEGLKDIKDNPERAHDRSDLLQKYAIQHRWKYAAAEYLEILNKLKSANFS